MTDVKLNEVFIGKFHPDKLGFFDVTPITNVRLGFSAKKKLRDDDNCNVTLLSLYIPERAFGESSDVLKPLSINLTYGREADQGGVYIRQDVKSTEPIDVTFPEEYFFNTLSGDFFKNKNKKIEADTILQEVYAKHVKPTRLITGFYLRSKIWLCRVFFNLLFVGLSKLFSALIMLISGDVYKYGILEHVNNKLKREQRPGQDYQSKQEHEKLQNQPSGKVSFLGYCATPACIMFYSLFHFVIYGFFYQNGIRPNFVVTIFKNPFLTLIYVMVSLIYIDKILPWFFRKAVDGSFELSVYFRYKTIRL